MEVIHVYGNYSVIHVNLLLGSPGRFPPMVHRQMAPDSQGQSTLGSQFSRSHNTEAIARAKGGGTGAGTGGKSNLAGQIIPIYGFGILMYILYILFKVRIWIRGMHACADRFKCGCCTWINSMHALLSHGMCMTQSKILSLSIYLSLSLSLRLHQRGTPNQQRPNFHQLDLKTWRERSVRISL